MEDTPAGLTHRNIRQKLVCPHCGERVELTLSLDIQTLGVDPATGPVPWEATATPEQHALMAEWRASGLLKAFEEAVEAMPAQSRPKSVERFWFTWLNKAGPRVVPPVALEVFKAAFPHTYVSCVAADGILAVLTNGLLRGFVPIALVVGRSVKSLGGNRDIKARLRIEPGPLDAWVRTRFGYVVGQGLAWEMLQERSVGAFARPPL